MSASEEYTKTTSVKLTEAQNDIWVAYAKMLGLNRVASLRHLLMSYVKAQVDSGKLDTRYPVGGKRTNKGKKKIAKKPPKRKKKVPPKRKKAGKKKVTSRGGTKKLSKKNPPKERVENPDAFKNLANRIIEGDVPSPPPVPRAPAPVKKPTKAKKGRGSRGPRRTKEPFTHEEVDQQVAEVQEIFRLNEELFHEYLQTYSDPERVRSAIERTAIKISKTDFISWVQVMQELDYYPKGIVEQAITVWEADGCPTMYYLKEILNRARAIYDKERGIED